MRCNVTLQSYLFILFILFIKLLKKFIPRYFSARINHILKTAHPSNLNSMITSSTTDEIHDLCPPDSIRHRGPIVVPGILQGP